MCDLSTAVRASEALFKSNYCSDGGVRLAEVETGITWWGAAAAILAPVPTPHVPHTFTPCIAIRVSPFVL